MNDEIDRAAFDEFLSSDQGAQAAIMFGVRYGGEPSDEKMELIQNFMRYIFRFGFVAGMQKARSGS